MEIPENYSAKRADDTPLRLTVPLSFAGLRLDQVLSRLLPQYSRSRLAQWVRANQVRLDGHAVLPRRRVCGGEVIDVVPASDPATLANEPEDIALEIVHEDTALLVINKPPGLVVQPGKGNWSGTLLNALLRHAPNLAQLPRAGIVHRLDKDTSGLLVVGKTLAAHTDLVRQLQARSVTREYLALVHGRVNRDGKVEAPIGRHPVKRTRMAVVASGRYAVTHYQVVERFSDTTLLRCRLETGRTHQIRVHLSSIKHPLVGDPSYGRRRAAPAFPRQALHAERLALRHPESRRLVSWRVAPPADLRRLILALRKHA